MDPNSMAAQTRITTSEMFASYEEDYKRNVASIKERLASSKSCSDAGEASRRLQELMKDITETDQILRQMELEVKTMPSKKSDIGPKVRGYRADLQSFSAEVRAQSESNSRKQLFTDGSGEHTREHEDRYRSSSQKIRESTSRVEEAKRTAMETENIGIEIMSDLRSQRETILRTRDHVRDVDSNLSRSRQLLISMGKRAATNKLILSGVIVMLVLAIIYVLYTKIVH
jgi:vesicle transport through interaction with t-SNAREs protein 1